MIREAEYLVATTIRQNGPFPMDEGVQPTQPFYGLVAWSEVKMIGVAQNRPYANLNQLLRGEGFDRALSAYRQKGRSGEGATACFNPPQPRFGRGVFLDDLKPESHISLRQCQMSKLKFQKNWFVIFLPAAAGKFEI